MSLVVLSYNVLATRHLHPTRYPDSPRGIYASEPRYERIAALVASFRADCICLQEVETRCFETLVRHLGPLGYEGTHDPRSAALDEGCALFLRSSRVRVLERQRVDFESAQDSPDPSPRLARIVRLETAGGPFLLANTHLQWDHPGTLPGQKRGEAQARQLVGRIEVLAPGDEPAMVCGDFNAGPGGSVSRLFTGSGFRAAREAGPEIPTCRANGRLSEVDFIFHRGFHGVRPLPRAGLSVSTPMPGEEHPSDHLPVCAEFQGWNPRP